MVKVRGLWRWRMTAAKRRRRGMRLLSTAGLLLFNRSSFAGLSALVVAATLTGCSGSSGGFPDWASSDDSCPAWSPDGKMLAFASTRGPPRQYNLFVVTEDGTHLRRLTRLPARYTLYGSAPTWSRDGRRIAFELVSSSGLTNYDYVGGSPLSGPVYQVNAIGRRRLRIVPDLANAGFVALPYPNPTGDNEEQYQCQTRSPDGTKVAFYRLISTGAGMGGGGFWARLGVVCVMNADGSGERRVTQLADTSSNCPDTRF